MKEKIKSFFQRNAPTTRKGPVSKKEYTKNFTQPPESLGESSDEEDSINRNGGSAKHLKYDSDDDKDDLKGEELISLDGASTGVGASRDRTNTAADNVPKQIGRASCRERV